MSDNAILDVQLTQFQAAYKAARRVLRKKERCYREFLRTVRTPQVFMIDLANNVHRFKTMLHRASRRQDVDHIRDCVRALKDYFRRLRSDILEFLREE